MLSESASPTLSAVSLGGAPHPRPCGTSVPRRPPFSWFFISGSFRKFPFARESRLAAQPPAQSGGFSVWALGPSLSTCVYLAHLLSSSASFESTFLGTVPRDPQLLLGVHLKWGFTCAASFEFLGLFLLPERSFSVTSGSPCQCQKLCFSLSHFKFYPDAWCWLVCVKRKGLQCRRWALGWACQLAVFVLGSPGGLWVREHSVPLLGPRGTCHHLLAPCVWSRRLHPVPASSHRMGLCVSVGPAFALMFTVGLPVGLDF